MSAKLTELLELHETIEQQEVAQIIEEINSKQVPKEESLSSEQKQAALLLCRK